MKLKITMKLKFYLISLFSIFILAALFIGASALRDKVNESYHWYEKALNNFDISKILPPHILNPSLEKNIISVQNKKYLLISAWWQTDKSQSHLYLVGFDFFKRPKLFTDLNLAAINNEVSFGPAHLEKLEDLNGDDKEEIVINLESGGAYIENYGLFEIDNNRLNWIQRKNKEGKWESAIFYEGSSVKNAALWQPLEGNFGLVQFIGEANDEDQWSWKAEAYFWQGEILVYDPTTSLKLSQKGPINQ